MENITMGTILAFIAGITAVWVFVERIINAVNKTLDEKLDPIKDDIKLCLNSEVLLMHHLTEGNHDDKIKELIKDIEKKLISK